jgi:hypothetical protein
MKPSWEATWVTDTVADDQIAVAVPPARGTLATTPGRSEAHA